MRRPVRHLLDLTTIEEGDTVIEIGPGKGIITRELLFRARKVIAVEKDPKSAQQLIRDLASPERLEVFQVDFLKFRLPKFSFKVFANIPFNLTTDIINELTSGQSKASDSYLIMQKEAAWRFVGEPYRRNSQRSILLSLDFSTEILCDIPRQSFKPVPAVDAVLFHLGKRELQDGSNENRQHLRDFIVYGFNQWAPSISRAYKKIFSHTQLKLLSRKFEFLTKKPSELSRPEWLELFEDYWEHVIDAKKALIRGSEKKATRSAERMPKLHRSRDD